MVLTFAESRMLLSEALGGGFRTWLCLRFCSGSERDEIEKELRKLSPEGGSVSGRVKRWNDIGFEYRMVLIVRRAGILESEEFKEFCEKHVNGKKMIHAEDYCDGPSGGKKGLKEAVTWMRGGRRGLHTVGEPFGDTWLELAILGEGEMWSLMLSRGRPLTNEGEWKAGFDAYEESRVKRKEDGRE